MIPEALLQTWLETRLNAASRAWLADAVRALRAETDDATLYRLISLVSRKIGKDDLSLSAAELRAAELARAGWNPADWSADQAARVLLLLAASRDAAAFARRLEQLCVTADVGELVAFYRGLPLYPEPARYVMRTAEGLRTNIKGVFEAIAHRNPYPAEQLADAQWNQLVLKSLFIGSRLYPIVGLDRRANPDLARMLVDYAHERWAAGRAISPELWRCVGPFAHGALLDDLRRVIDTGTGPERTAAALALSRSPDPSAAALLHAHADLQAQVEAGADWQDLASGARNFGVLK